MTYIFGDNYCDDTAIRREAFDKSKQAYEEVVWGVFFRAMAMPTKWGKVVVVPIPMAYRREVITSISSFSPETRWGDIRDKLFAAVAGAIQLQDKEDSLALLRKILLANLYGEEWEVGLPQALVLREDYFRACFLREEPQRQQVSNSYDGQRVCLVGRGAVVRVFGAYDSEKETTFGTVFCKRPFGGSMMEAGWKKTHAWKAVRVAAKVVASEGDYLPKQNRVSTPFSIVNSFKYDS